MRIAICGWHSTFKEEAKSFRGRARRSAGLRRDQTLEVRGELIAALRGLFHKEAAEKAVSFWLRLIKLPSL